jgi:hypothetical protein
MLAFTTIYEKLGGRVTFAGAAVVSVLALVPARWIGARRMPRR